MLSSSARFFKNIIISLLPIININFNTTYLEMQQRKWDTITDNYTKIFNIAHRTQIMQYNILYTIQWRLQILSHYAVNRL